MDTTCNENYNTHPFSNTLKRFQSGGVHPIVFGAFGETDRATVLIIKRYAKMAAARVGDSNVPPLSDNGNHGRMLHVMLTQFWGQYELWLLELLWR